ncbi:MAG TPA: hypothetical protein VI056_06460 [Candidatus Limnocylindria bacterium]
MELTELLERLPVPWLDRQGLAVEWFEPWDLSLESALRSLPESLTSPHELLGLLMRNVTTGRKRTALVTRGGRPVAVLGLRRWMRFWEPVWWRGPINERFTSAAHEAELLPALAATGLNIWMVTRSAPEMGRVRSATQFPVYKIPCADSERVWRETGHWKRIREARNRTRGFMFEIDPPGAAEWTIRNWARKWHAYEAESDLLLAAEYFAQRDLCHVAVLREGGVKAASCMFLVVGDELLAQVNFHSEDYRWHAAQTRLYDLVVAWAYGSGVRSIDMGVSYGKSYKQRWAVRDGTAWMFNVAPAHLHFMRSAVKAGASALGSVRRFAPKGTT